jgi:hypothetical protein
MSGEGGLDLGGIALVEGSHRLPIADTWQGQSSNQFGPMPVRRGSQLSMNA